MVRSGRRVSVQPPSWTRRWCRPQSGSRLSRSVSPWCSHGMTWWIRQSSNRTPQPGWAQVAFIARSARRCSAVASRLARPTSVTTPAPSNTTGMMAASQHIRRTDAAGMGLPSPVSHTPWSCNPWRNVSRSMSTVTSGTRRPGSPVAALGGRVIRSTRASACNWSNVKSGSCGLARAAATAASKAAATRASVSASSSRWVWHTPVARSTQRRTLRLRRLRCCSLSPSSPDSNRSSGLMPLAKSSTVDEAAAATIAGCRAASCERPASSSAAAVRAIESTCPADRSPAANASCTSGN
ncbi:hypothetical protein BH18ACT2_BH18ACT2_15740 [soil metagenome]